MPPPADYGGALFYAASLSYLYFSLAASTALIYLSTSSLFAYSSAALFALSEASFLAFSSAAAFFSAAYFLA